MDLAPMDLSEEDVLKAMKDIPGYLDITPGDFKEIYSFAYRHAVERQIHSTRAQDVMTEEVVFVNRTTPLKDVAEILNRHDISGVPVVDDENKVVGVISEKDFLFNMGAKETRTFMGVVAHCLKNKGCVAISMQKQKAQDIMSSPAVTVSENTLVSEIAGIFTEKKINRTPVTDRNDILIGIVTRTDIVKSYCSSG
ncbi:MAG: CBS domain-containing protein [Deltaproteobacteria bacterium]|nr:CBS domain-containing protein [Deltaproteobacteria bacterium]